MQPFLLAAYMAANTVSDVIHAQAEISACDGYMQVRVDERTAPRCRDVLEGLKLHLLGLEEQYPKNIKSKLCGGVNHAED